VKHSLKATRLDSDLERGEPVVIYVDGRPVRAYKGETIATALMAAGHWVCQTHQSTPMGVFCNVGVCHGCLMTVDGKAGVKTCSTMVAEGCRVETRRIHRRESTG
jgi:sarcosine oxidase subunit alpha